MPNYRISFQLYSARNFPPIEKHLETLAAIGFDAVEPYGGAYKADPKGLRAKCDALGLKIPTCHMALADLDADRAAVIDTAKILGLETVIVPAVPQEQRSQDVAGWKALGAKLQEHAAAVKAAGLKFAWHNHAFEYVTLSDGSRPISYRPSPTPNQRTGAAVPAPTGRGRYAGRIGFIQNTCLMSVSSSS